MKSVAKRMLGPIYPMALKAVTSEPVREAKAFMGQPAYRARRKTMGKVLCVDVFQKAGMGAVISEALLFHRLAEDEGLAPDIYSTNPLYLPAGAQDVFSTYFDRPPPAIATAPLRDNSYMWALRRVVPKDMSLAAASALVNTHFRPNAEIRQRIDAVLDGREGFDLSIHYRGTDKVLESGAQDMTIMLDLADEYLGSTSGKQVFLATDDARFREALPQRYPQHQFISYDLATLDPETPRHFSNMLPEEKAIEAIVNIYLLAKSPVILRTSSYMSAISVLANPAIRSITINKTLTGRRLFPEHQILEAEARRG